MQHDKNENRIIRQIDAEKICKRDLALWKKIIKNRDFITDLKLRKQAMIIAQSISYKLRWSDVIAELENGNMESFTEKLVKLADRYEPVITPQTVNLNVGGQEDNVLRVIYENGRKTGDDSQTP